MTLDVMAQFTLAVGSTIRPSFANLRAVALGLLQTSTDELVIKVRHL